MSRLIAIWISLALNLIVVRSSGQESTSDGDFYVISNASMTYNKVNPVFWKSFKIEAGDSLVFVHSSVVKGEEGNDSEAPVSVVFQVDRRLTEFQLRDDEMYASGAIYIQECRCADFGISRIKKGYVRGVQVNGFSWELEYKVTVEGHLSGYTYELEGKGTYTLRER